MRQPRPPLLVQWWTHGPQSSGGDRHTHRWFQCSVYMCCLSSLFLLSPPLQERKTPFLQALTPAGPGQQPPQRQRGQEELSEPQRPFKLFLRMWNPGRSCGGKSMHFLLGHEINHPFLVSKIMTVRTCISWWKGRGENEKFHHRFSFLPFENQLWAFSLRLRNKIGDSDQMSTDANFHNTETLTGRENPRISSLVSAFQPLYCSKLCSYYRWLPFRLGHSCLLF